MAQLIPVQHQGTTWTLHGRSSAGAAPGVLQIDPARQRITVTEPGKRPTQHVLTDPHWSDTTDADGHRTIAFDWQAVTPGGIDRRAGGVTLNTNGNVEGHLTVYQPPDFHRTYFGMRDAEGYYHDDRPGAPRAQWSIDLATRQISIALSSGVNLSLTVLPAHWKSHRRGQTVRYRYHYRDEGVSVTGMAAVLDDGRAFGKFRLVLGQAHRALYTLDGLDIPETAGSQVAYYHNDHLGTPRALSDEQGRRVWAATRLPFGETRVTREAVTNPLRFPGQYYDEESGLHYNYFRDYDPATGRYIQSDPIGLEGGLNTYAYVGGNPLSRIDPTGEAFFAIPFFAGAGGGSASTAVGGGFLGLGLLGAWGAYNEGVGDVPSDVPSSQPEQCEDDDRCEELGKRAKGQAKRVNEHVLNEHFHSKPCINLSQTLSTAKAIGCNLTTPNFSYAITVFNAVCTDPSRFPPPYAKPQGPPYEPY